jgi:UDP-N-acetylmuramate--alanine ligase
VILCIDNAENRSILPKIERRVVSYGLSADADFQAVPIFKKEFTSEFQVFHHGMNLGSVRLNVPGSHSIVNSLAGLAVASELGISFDTAREALAAFHGVDRRFQLKCDSNDILIVDDYAHHPTEIEATLKAARSGWNRRIIAVFQPHRYTRLQHLMDGFAGSFSESDALFLTDIYPAGEKPIPGVTAERLAEKISHSQFFLHKDLDTLPEKVLSFARPGDLILFLGAGSITSVADRTARLLQESVAKS